MAAARQFRSTIAVQFRDRYGFWADFIHPTAMAEGALFHTLNTYDRAFFTFSFLQFAAHVLERRLRRVPARSVEAAAARRSTSQTWWLVGDRICRLTDSGSVQLESDTSTRRAVRLPEPDGEGRSKIPVDPGGRVRVQGTERCTEPPDEIDVGVAHFAGTWRQYATRYNLDGAPRVICLVVADIRHQGRARAAGPSRHWRARSPWMRYSVWVPRCIRSECGCCGGRSMH